MLLIHYVSVMMCIFYIDWQQYWKCDWTMNIGANAHGKWTVSTKLPQHNWRQTWQSGFQWHRRGLHWASFQVNRLFHSATIFWMLHVLLHVFCYLKVTRLITRMDKEFLCVCGSGKGVRVGGVVVGMGGWVWVGGGAPSFNVFRCCILISRLPRVFRRFKHRSLVGHVVSRPIYVYCKRFL